MLLSETALSRRLSALDADTDRTGPHPSGLRVVAGGNFATPRRLLEVFDAAVSRYRLFMINAQPPLPEREGVTFETPFVGPGMRRTGSGSNRLDYLPNRLDYLPMRLSLVPQLFERVRPPDVVLVQTTVPRDRRVSLGIEVNILVAAIEQVKARGGLVVAQLNPRMPTTFGDAELDTDLIDVAFEAEEALGSPPRPTPGGRALEIGARVASLVGDGSTLQLGIGAIPDAALAALATRRGLGVWSEMVSDGVLAMDRAGALDPLRQIAASFLFGSPELYAWVDGNPRVQLLRTEKTNDPGRIARQPRMTSINTALQVDLFAQANASYIGTRVYSGFGGQTDFIVGALHSDGGQAIIALPSWHEKSGTSTVVPRLETPSTSFQHTAIVTEQGVAQIFGRSQRAQAGLIIDHVAHPEARDALRSAAAAVDLV